MKNLFKLVILLSLAALSPSCGNSPSSSAKLPPLKIEVPSELKGNKEIVQFIKNSEDAINIYSNSAKELAEDCKDFIGKDENDLSVLDKVKMVAAFGQFTANFAQFATKYSEITEQTQLLEEGLTEEQTAALATVMEAFKQRMEQLEEKYKNYGVQN